MKTAWLTVSIILFLLSSFFLINGFYTLIYSELPYIPQRLQRAWIMGFVVGSFLLEGTLYFLSYKAYQKAKASSS